ncbi:hypothetical protein [Methylobacterium brachythecii]|uniref:Uncharacterized protein n=1 Tax=Methylobacterium brachythecii TaxID=1176177 RepID=A0A7W6AJI5_9HYPH|nr:hypothetical protein [Methylobacterium brachythecii]MBB3902490.1 hypothetical protein [Methylobacterium brachythecii]
MRGTVNRPACPYSGVSSLDFEPSPGVPFFRHIPASVNSRGDADAIEFAEFLGAAQHLPQG